MGSGSFRFGGKLTKKKGGDQPKKENTPKRIPLWQNQRTLNKTLIWKKKKK